MRSSNSAECRVRVPAGVRGLNGVCGAGRGGRSSLGYQGTGRWHNGVRRQCIGGGTGRLCTRNQEDTP